MLRFDGPNLSFISEKFVLTSFSVCQGKFPCQMKDTFSIPQMLQQRISAGDS